MRCFGTVSGSATVSSATVPPTPRMDPALKAYGDDQMKDNSKGPLTLTSWRFAKKNFKKKDVWVSKDFGESRIHMFCRTSAERLAAATVEPAPILNYGINLPRVPQCTAAEIARYCLGTKLGVSREGEILRASDDDIEAALKKIPGLPPGVTAPAWLELVAHVFKCYAERSEQHRSCVICSMRGLA